MNAAGLRDYNLAWKLWAVTKGKAGPVLLETYETERRTPAWNMVQLAVAMGDIVADAPGQRHLALRQLSSVDGPVSPPRDFIIQMANHRPAMTRARILTLMISRLPGPSSVRCCRNRWSARGQRRDPSRRRDRCRLRAPCPIEATGRAMAAARGTLWPELDPALIAIIEIKSPISGTAVFQPVLTDHAPVRAHRDRILYRPDRYARRRFLAGADLRGGRGLPRGRWDPSPLISALRLLGGAPRWHCEAGDGTGRGHVRHQLADHHDRQNRASSSSRTVARPRSVSAPGQVGDRGRAGAGLCRDRCSRGRWWSRPEPQPRSHRTHGRRVMLVRPSQAISGGLATGDLW